MTRTSSTRLGGLGPVERLVRIIGGCVLAVVSVSLSLSSTGLVPWVWVAVALLGLDFVVTGVRGHCPLYARLGIGRQHEEAGG